VSRAFPARKRAEYNLLNPLLSPARTAFQALMRMLRAGFTLLLTLGWSLAAGAQSAATFSGTLVRRDSTAVAMAKIKLPLLDRTATTDDSGHFELKNVPPGKHELTVWAPGAAPVSMELVLLAGESYNMRIVLADDVQQLKEITVSAPRDARTATSRRLEDFERRRRRGNGVFLTEADIARRNPRLLSDALVGINGIQLMTRGSGKVAIASRGLAPQTYQGGKTAAPCMLRLIIDGMAMPAGSSLDNVTPNEVAGMEIYAGPASTPVELAHYQEDSWCGAILIWTKGG